MGRNRAGWCVPMAMIISSFMMVFGNPITAIWVLLGAILYTLLVIVDFV
jgi:hypothetical protein